ncbi:MAG: LptF/LptG family permease [Devosia sp.]
MSRLTRYLLRQFSVEAMALFAVATLLLFLIQLLRLFDSIAGRGQGLITLIGQALLGIPSIGIAFLYICLGIGLGRALRNMQGSSELAIIHTSHLLPGLLRAIVAYIVLGVLALLLIAHLVEPAAQRTASRWQASIAAELVGRSLVPHKFISLVGDVTVSIGGRAPDGAVTAFFADDSRNPATRRSYLAERAYIAQDARGYVLQLHNGVVQFQTADKEFGEFSFDRYDLALDRLTDEKPDVDTLEEKTSIELISAAVANGDWNDDLRGALIRRSAEALRVAAMCLLVTALAAFPSGARRRFEFPIELVVLIVAFAERGFTAASPMPGPAGGITGGLVLLVLSIALLLWRLRPIRPRVVRVRPVRSAA